MTTLKNKVVLITGASRGLGKALALNLANQGARLALVARSEKDLFEVAAQINGTGGVARAYPADIANKNSVHAIVGKAQFDLGPIDILVNNASSLGPIPLRPLLDSECEDFEAVLQLNLLAPYRLGKAILGGQLVKKSGLVINISSDASVGAYPKWGFYSAAKAALDHLTRVWAEELKDSGLKILAYDPTEMDTLMHAQAIPDADRASLATSDEIADDLSQLVLNSDKFLSGSRIIAKSWRHV